MGSAWTQPPRSPSGAALQGSGPAEEGTGQRGTPAATQGCKCAAAGATARATSEGARGHARPLGHVIEAQVLNAGCQSPGGTCQTEIAAQRKVLNWDRTGCA